MVLFVSLSSLPLPPIAYEVGIELRLDLFPRGYDSVELKKIIKTHLQPLLLTLRSAGQGGKFQGSRKDYEERLLALLELNPPFLDVEWEEGSDFPHLLAKKISRERKGTRLILSHHLPRGRSCLGEVKRIYSQLLSFSAYTYKIALTPSSTIETLSCLNLAKESPKLSLICMGERANFSRLLTPLVSCSACQYAALTQEEAVTIGQLPLSDMEEIYRYTTCNQQTALFALIGDPVEQSQGHLYHNGVFARENKNALYVKIPLSQEELPFFFPLAKELGIQGLSVSMPLKEQVLSYLAQLDGVAQECVAVNTIIYKEGKFYGTNTDGVGALDALEQQGAVKGKSVAILGTGGAARAIAFEAKRRHAAIQIIGRSLEKSTKLAQEVGGIGYTFSDPLLHFDIAINTTPQCPPLAFETLSPSTLFMDIVYKPRETPFLKKAKDLKCKIVYGEEMFFNQAARQQCYWRENLSLHQELCLPPSSKHDGPSR